MAKPHKDAGLTTEVVTALSDGQIAECSQRAAQAITDGGGWDLGMHVKLEKSEPGLLEYVVLGIGGLAWVIKFAVTVTPAEGKTRVGTAITSYRTRQSAIAGVVPTGPKRINGLRTYRRFCANLAEQLTAADAAAHVHAETWP
jgi:hypothetical protein